MAPDEIKQKFLAQVADGDSIAGLLYKGLHWRDAWRGGEIRQCIFEENTFADTEWQACHADMVIFVRGAWSRVVFKDCVFSNSRFVDCVFDACTFHAQQFIGCVFERCVLRGCDASEGAVANTQMLDLRVEDCRIDKWVLTGNQDVTLRFKDSAFQHLALADFDFANLAIENTRFTNLIALECTAKAYDFSGLHLVQSQFTDSRMAGADFSQAELSQSCFKGCDLQACRFDHATLRQALLLEANAAHAVFAGAQMECANLSGANCERAVFRGADMNMAILNQCDLQHADFGEGSMPFTDFSYSNLSQADFRGGHFMRSKLHAVIDNDTRYGSRDGVLPPDRDLLHAEQWVKL